MKLACARRRNFFRQCWVWGVNIVYSDMIETQLVGCVALILKTSLKPVAVAVPPSIEVVAVKVSLPIPIVIVAVYRPPTQSMSYFSKKITEILTLLKNVQVCLVGDLNEDILLSKNKTCCEQLKKIGLRQWVDKPTRDSGTLIDHLYTSSGYNSDMCCY